MFWDENRENIKVTTEWIAHENTVKCVQELKKGTLTLQTLRNVRNTNS